MFFFNTSSYIVREVSVNSIKPDFQNTISPWSCTWKRALNLYVIIFLDPLVTKKNDSHTHYRNVTLKYSKVVFIKKEGEKRISEVLLSTCYVTIIKGMKDENKIFSGSLCFSHESH